MDITVVNKIVPSEKNIDLDVLLHLYNEVLANLRDRARSRHAKNAYGIYKKNLTPIVETYAQNGSLEEHNFYNRYLTEAALFHFAIKLVEALFPRSNASKKFQNQPAAKHYLWYSIPAYLQRKIIWTVRERHDAEKMANMFSLLCDAILSNDKIKSLGEFYTPAELANHIVTIVEIPELESLEICDPACGSGNLLAAAAKIIIAASLSKKEEGVKLFESINNNLYGFDIQPIAVIMTKVHLLIICLPLLSSGDEKAIRVMNQEWFPNVVQKDPIATKLKDWVGDKKFDIIVCNPPFNKLTSKNIDWLKDYNFLLSGQANSFQLFLGWAIAHIIDNGVISFLIPSILQSGQYCAKLREHIHHTCVIRAVTMITNRTGIFGTVEQQTMVIGLQKTNSQDSIAEIRVHKDSNGIAHASPLALTEKSLVRYVGKSPIWFISSSNVDYTILEKILNKQKTLSELTEYLTLNGGFVWNQEKPRLTNIRDGNNIPLISSPSISPSQFTFPPNDDRVKDRLFVIKDNSSTRRKYSEVGVLVKRTTPQKNVGRRIIASVVEENFIRKYKHFYVENHVNIIVSNNGRAKSNENGANFIGLSVWLNSKLANFVFSMINNSSHISKFELEFMPIPFELLASVEREAVKLQNLSLVKSFQTLDELFYDHYGLSKKEKTRVEALIPGIQQNAK